MGKQRLPIETNTALLLESIQQEKKFTKSPSIITYLLVQIVYGGHLQVIAFVNCQAPEKSQTRLSNILHYPTNQI
jgi:hypothetical protein